MAGAESAAAGREHDHADGRVRGDAVERRLQLVDERARQRVELARPVERHRGDAVRRVDEQLGLGLVVAVGVVTCPASSSVGP